MEKLTVEELQSLPEGSVVYDRSNDKLWRTPTGWRYSPVSDNGSYLETSSHTADRLWGPMTQGFKVESSWAVDTVLNNAKDLIEAFTEVWDDADRHTQELLVEMVKDWLDRKDPSKG